jgi:hypothetical protein
MKAILEDIKTNQGKSSFHVFRYQVPYFQFKWHYHPEFELTYIVKGNGYRIVGNSYEPFADGDLVLLGSNLPHTWSGKADGEVNSDAIVIQFSSEFISPFLELNESLLIKKLLDSSLRGIDFQPDDQLVSKIIELNETNGVDRILNLISILDILSKKQFKFIAPNTFHNVVSKKSEARINKVCLFIQNNYHNKIYLKEVADLIYLTESNFPVLVIGIVGILFLEVGVFLHFLGKVHKLGSLFIRSGFPTLKPTFIKTLDD